MRISQHFGSYNARRYGKPWVSKIVAWPVGGKSEVVWGSYLGDDNGGEVEIEANVGDIIRTGQKDGRGGNTSADWYVVEPDGSLREIDAAEARKLFGKVPAQDTSDKIALMAEKEKLLARIAEIDMLLKTTERNITPFEN